VVKLSRFYGLFILIDVRALAAQWMGQMKGKLLRLFPLKTWPPLRLLIFQLLLNVVCADAWVTVTSLSCLIMWYEFIVFRETWFGLTVNEHTELKSLLQKTSIREDHPIVNSGLWSNWRIRAYFRRLFMICLTNQTNTSHKYLCNVPLFQKYIN